MALISEIENRVIRQDVAQSLYEVSSVKRGMLGGVLEFADGRLYRYCASDSDIGVACAVTGTENDQAIAATYFGATTSVAPAAKEGGTIGDTTVRICVVTGTATITANEYAGGFLTITDGVGKGYTYKVAANEANAASGSSLITLWYGHGLAVALDNTSVGLLQCHPWGDVKIGAYANFGGDQNQVYVGQTVAAWTGATNSRTEYGWILRHGYGVYLSGAAVQKHGGILSIAEDVNGALQLAVEADGEYAYQACGIALADGVNTKYGPCWVMAE